MSNDRLNLLNRYSLEPLRKYPCIFAYWIPFILSLIYLSVFTKTQGFVIINHEHNAFFDVFFKALTFLGDGIFAIILVMFLVTINRKRLAGSLLISFLVSGLLSCIFKLMFHSPRPHSYFGTEGLIRSVPGVVVHNSNSFPSGHTITAFATLALLALATKHKWQTYVFFFIAWLIGYSRIYLGQHFPADVCAGAFVGTFTAVVCYNLHNNTIMWRRFKVTCRQLVKKSFLANWPLVERFV
ncbi:phosphatase PAP2 family protein [Pinibacter soli]|uniref:Phosphatase PAP2 family protein n=1 Tax=Pinibacter soli TaxID=3044211 RepID=A0ABT6RL27_9BACT|nr:phosphatase PAP2 family protein [Pinibacter soli]MDI3322532.1 phosphatase PAP2 family protein [Pinibacter soli]